MDQAKKDDIINLLYFGTIAVIVFLWSTVVWESCTGLKYQTSRSRHPGRVATKEDMSRTRDLAEGVTIVAIPVFVFAAVERTKRKRK